MSRATILLVALFRLVISLFGDHPQTTLQLFKTIFQSPYPFWRNQYAISSSILDESSAHLITTFHLLENCSKQLDSVVWYKNRHVPRGKSYSICNFCFLFFLMQVMGLLQVVVYNAGTKLDCQSQSDKETQNPATDEAGEDVKKEPVANEDKCVGAESSTSDGKRNSDAYNIFLQLPQSDLSNLCSLLGREGYYSMILCTLICSLAFSVVIYQ